MAPRPPDPAAPRLRRRLTGRGRGLVALAILVLGAAAWTGNNQLFLVLGGLQALLVLELALGAVNLRGVRAARQLPAELFAGRRAAGSLLLQNRRRGLPALALALEEVGGGEACAQVAWLGAGASLEVAAGWRFPSRGRYRLEGLRLRSRFPFGLLEHRLDLARTAEVLVWPAAVFSAGHPAAPTPGSHRADDHHRDPRPGGTGDYLDLREYAPGDPPRQIHWPTTARLGRPMVVVRGREIDDQVVVALRRERDPERWERAIGEACGQVVQHVRLGRAVGLTCEARSWPARRGVSQLRALLEALALLPRAEDGEAAP
jgi:uncharacterized protein (DUF58 family)